MNGAIWFGAFEWRRWLRPCPTHHSPHPSVTSLRTPPTCSSACFYPTHNDTAFLPPTPLYPAHTSRMLQKLDLPPPIHAALETSLKVFFRLYFLRAVFFSGSLTRICDKRKIRLSPSFAHPPLLPYRGLANRGACAFLIPSCATLSTRNSAEPIFRSGPLLFSTKQIDLGRVGWKLVSSSPPYQLLDPLPPTGV